VKDIFLRAESGARVAFPENNVSKCGNVLSAAPERALAVEAAESAARELLIALEGPDPETEAFLLEQAAWPPSAYILPEELAEALAALPDPPPPENPAGTEPSLIPFPALSDSALTDWLGRSVPESLSAVRRVTGLRLPERGEAQEKVAALIEEATTEKTSNSKINLRGATPEEAGEIRRQGGPNVSAMTHDITAHELRYALNRHGRADEAAHYPGQRPLSKQDLALIPAVIDAPTNIKVQLHGKNKTSVVYSRDFENGTICYVERVIETSNEFEPRLTMKTAWVQDAEAGVKSNSTTVYTPYRNTNILPKGGPVNTPLLGRRFWAALVRGGYQGAAYAVERFLEGKPALNGGSMGRG
jgi:hypothetical protein